MESRIVEKIGRLGRRRLVAFPAKEDTEDIYGYRDRLVEAYREEFPEDKQPEWEEAEAWANRVIAAYYPDSEIGVAFKQEYEELKNKKNIFKKISNWRSKRKEKKREKKKTRKEKRQARRKKIKNRILKLFKKRKSADEKQRAKYQRRRVKLERKLDKQENRKTRKNNKGESANMFKRIFRKKQKDSNVLVTDDLITANKATSSQINVSDSLIKETANIQNNSNLSDNEKYVVNLNNGCVQIRKDRFETLVLSSYCLVKGTISTKSLSSTEDGKAYYDKALEENCLAEFTTPKDNDTYVILSEENYKKLNDDLADYNIVTFNDQAIESYEFFKAKAIEAAINEIEERYNQPIENLKKQNEELLEKRAKRL